MQPSLVLTLPTPPKAQPRPRCACMPNFSKGKCGACGNPIAKPNAQMHSGARGSKKRKGKPDRRSAQDDPLAIFAKWRDDVAMLIRANWRNPPLCGPLRASFTFVTPRPQSRPTVAKFTTETTGGVTRKILNPRWVAGDWIVKPEDWARGDRVPCPVKPDIDRYVNAIMDQLTVARVWWDDAQVCGGPPLKFYAAAGEEPSIRLRVEPW